MDTAMDYEPFRGLLDQLCATFDRPPAKNEMIEAYWNSLRDARFGEIKRNVERIIRTATSETKWPKPGDLRDAAPESNSRRSAAMEADFKSAEERAVRNLEALNREDPELWQIEVAIARCGRILSSEQPDTPQFAEALQLDRQYRDRRQALWKRQADASNNKRDQT